MTLYWLALRSACKAFSKQYRKRLTELRKRRAAASKLDTLDRL
jgi:hypothetical protein